MKMLDFSDLARMRKIISEKLIEHRLLTSQREELETEREKIQQRLSDTLEARTVIQDVSQALQQDAQQRISAVVSRCLEAVFAENAYQFEIVMEQKRGKTEAVLRFVRETLVLDDPTNQAGCGQVDVAAFALRLAVLVLHRPPLRRLLVLDEPFKNVRGKVYKNRVRDLLLILADEMEVQFVVCVDHEAYPQFVLGHVVEVG